MFTPTISKEQKTVDYGSNATGSGQPPRGGSSTLLHEKQHRMRVMIAQRLPKTDLCSVSSSIDSHSFQMLHPGATIVRVVSLAESGYKNFISNDRRETWEQLRKPEKQQHTPSPTDVDGDPSNSREASKAHVPPAEQEQISTPSHAAKRSGRRFSLKVGNASLKRLVSGAFAGAVSRTAVAPLETIRTHLMVGSGGRTVGEVFQHIMQNEGWLGLFRGNGVNVIRVAPSKAIELFTYDTIKKSLDRSSWISSHIPVPSSSIAGATAGVCSTLCTYPLELLKTRLTIQRGVYKNLMDAFVKIYQQEGPRELYRGLTPSLIGVIPYAATNYFAYDFLRRLYKKVAKQEQVGNLATLLIGSAAAALASASTFPLEVARKQMQVGALTGRTTYDNLFHALSSLLEQHGPIGLYRGLGASCFKLIPAAGISFMCYEAFKRVLIEEEEEAR